VSLADEVCDAKKAVRSVRSRTVAAARDAVERPERLQLQAATARLRNAMQLLHGQEWSRLVSIPGLHNKLISSAVLRELSDQDSRCRQPLCWLASPTMVGDCWQPRKMQGCCK